MPRSNRSRTAGATCTVVAAASVVVAALTGCSSTRTNTPDALPAVHDMRSAPCAAESLAVSIGGRDGAALPAAAAPDQATEVALVLENTGAESCSLQGWPSAQYAVDGRAIGKAALRVRAVPDPAVVLRPGTVAQAYLTMREDDSLGSCGSGSPDSIEVVAPGTGAPIRAALPAALSRPACISAYDTVLSVQAVIPL